MATPQTSARPARGAELELTVDTLAHGGNGVARLDGYVVFVAGALPGDRVRAVVGKAKRAYAEARAVEILEPSPDRIEPLAAHPGAPWQVLSYDRQLEVKAEQVGDALRRIGRLDGFEQEPIVPAVEQWRYRNKLEYSFGTGAGGELVCGFHAPAASTRSSRSTTACSPPSAATPPASRCWPGAASRASRAWDRRDAAAACCATWSCARAAAPASCRSGSSRRRARSTRDGLAAAVDCEGLFWTQADRRWGRPPRAARPSGSPDPSGCASSSASSSS